MKKLVYILVAVFTMVSVNAFGAKFTLHYAYPGSNLETDTEVNEIIFMDVLHYKYFNVYSDESYTNEIEFKAPTCKGYKFAGYYNHWTENGLNKTEKVFDEDGSLLEHYTTGCHLYAHWEKDTENFIWKDDGSGFYERDEFGHKDKNSFTPWNYMVIDKIPHTYLYLHYAYPGCNKEVVNQTIYVDESSFKYIVDESFHISPVRKYESVIYKDETKKEVVDIKFPEIKGYRFVAFKSESGIDIINYDGINEWFDSKAVPTPHLYGYWEKDTENYEWSIDGKKFYDKTGQWKRGKWVPWDYMKDEETTTDINEVEVSNEVKSNKAEGIYTLNGVKVNEITKSGIYIVNGKKVVKK